jgi:hypothetical protein
MALPSIFRILCFAAWATASGCAEIGFPIFTLAEAAGDNGTSTIEHAPVAPTVSPAKADAPVLEISRPGAAIPDFPDPPEGIAVPPEFEPYVARKEGKTGRAARLDAKVLADAGIALPSKSARVRRGIAYAREEEDEVWAFDFDGLGELELAVLRRITDRHPRPEEDDDWEPYENKYLVLLEKRCGAWVVIHEDLRAYQQAVHLGFFDFDGDGDSEIAEEMDGVRGNRNLSIWFRDVDGAVREARVAYRAGDPPDFHGTSVEGEIFSYVDIDGNGTLEVLRLFPVGNVPDEKEEIEFFPDAFRFHHGVLEAANGVFGGFYRRIRERAAQALHHWEAFKPEPGSRRDPALYHASAARAILAMCDEVLEARGAKGPGG